MTTTKRTATVLYRGERFKIAIVPDGYMWTAICIAHDGEDVQHTGWHSGVHESPGEAVGALVTELVDATELTHAEMAMESERDGMTV